MKDLQNSNHSGFAGSPPVPLTKGTLMLVGQPANYDQHNSKQSKQGLTTSTDTLNNASNKMYHS